MRRTSIPLYKRTHERLKRTKPEDQSWDSWLMNIAEGEGGSG